MSCILWSGLSWQCTLLLLIRMEVGTEAEAQFNEPTFHIQWFSNNISVEVHIDFGTSFNNLISEQSSTRVPLSFPLVSGSAPDALTPQQQSSQVGLHFDLFGYFQLVLFSPSLSLPPRLLLSQLVVHYYYYYLEQNVGHERGYNYSQSAFTVV